MTRARSTLQSTLKRAGLVALAVGLCLGLSTGPTGATANAGPPPEGGELAPTMVVLDASGSMTGDDPAGGNKMDAAKRAVHTLIDTAPAGASMGLAAYGTGTGNSDAEKESGCQDVTVLREPAPIDTAAMAAAVDSLVPRGYTPIGRALQVAADALPQEGPRSIVLVSDGEDTCAPPEPCEVVRTLAGQGVDLVVHAVGFGVDDVARAQLSCVAQTTGGTYTDAPDADALERVLPRVTTTAMRNFEPAGTPLVGTPSWNAAPTAEPGQYLDTVGQKETRYYAVDVPAGATAYFSATVGYPRVPNVDILDDFNSLQLRTYGEGGEDCHEFESEQASDSSEGAVLTVATTWDGAAKADSGRGSNKTDKPCAGGGRYFFALTWDRVSAGVPARLPVELLVGVEPGVTDPGPVAVLPETALTAAGAAATPVVGGGSFNVAGALNGSGTYADTLRRGEFLFYKVHLDWGQGLAYRVRFQPTTGRGLDNLSSVSARLYNPNREEISAARMSYNGELLQLPLNDPALATVPVRYGNREADVNSARTQSLEGWYYLSVDISSSWEGAAAPVPVELDLTVAGSPEPGPAYAFASPEAQQSGLFGENRAAAAKPGPAAQPNGTAAGTTDPAAPTSSFGINPIGWAVLGAAGALVLVGAGLLIARARRRPGR